LTLPARSVKKKTLNVAARVQTLTRIHQADILVTEALCAKLDVRFVLMPMPAEFAKRIAEARGHLRRARRAIRRRPIG
jgi:hypothetical protein